MPKSRRTKKFQIVTTPQEFQLAEDLAEVTGHNKSQIYREAVLNRHTMQMQGVATCADGQRCACPQYVRQPPITPAARPYLSDLNHSIIPDEGKRPPEQSNDKP